MSSIPRWKSAGGQGLILKFLPWKQAASPLDDLFISTATSFRSTGTSSFASVSPSVFSQQISGLELYSGLHYRALSWHLVREMTAKRKVKAFQQPSGCQPTQPHVTFFLRLGERKGLIFPPCLQVAAAWNWSHSCLMRDQMPLCIPSELPGFRSSRQTAVPYHWAMYVHNNDS